MKSVVSEIQKIDDSVNFDSDETDDHLQQDKWHHSWRYQSHDDLDD